MKRKSPHSISVFAFLVGCSLTLTLRAESLFQHTTSGENTSLHVSQLDHLSLNGNSDGIVLLTTSWGTSGAYNAHPMGVYYASGRWNVFNQDLAPLPHDLTVNVLSLAPSDRAFLHQATASSISGHATKIDHPSLNGAPDANPIVTQKWEGTYNPHTIGVFYGSDGFWRVFNRDGTAMPIGAAFHVAVCDSTEVLEITDPLGHSHLVDESWDGQPDRLIFLTQRGHLLSDYAHETGLWYTGDRWRVFNHDLTPMLQGEFFHVLSTPLDCLEHGGSVEIGGGIVARTAPVSLDMQPVEGDAVTLQLSGDSRATYRVEASPDMADWRLVRAGVRDGDTIEVTESSVRQFYRAVLETD